VGVTPYVLWILGTLGPFMKGLVLIRGYGTFSVASGCISC